MAALRKIVSRFGIHIAGATPSNYRFNRFKNNNDSTNCYFLKPKCS